MLWAHRTMVRFAFGNPLKLTSIHSTAFSPTTRTEFVPLIAKKSLDIRCCRFRKSEKSPWTVRAHEAGLRRVSFPRSEECGLDAWNIETTIACWKRRRKNDGSKFNCRRERRKRSAMVCVYSAHSSVILHSACEYAVSHWTLSYIHFAQFVQTSCRVQAELLARNYIYYCLRDRM